MRTWFNMGWKKNNNPALTDRSRELSSGNEPSPLPMFVLSCAKKLQRHMWLMWHYEKQYWQLCPHSSSGSAVSHSFSRHPSSSQPPSPPRWKSNKSADIDPVSPAGLISFQPERDGYRRRSWQIIVFTVFFSQANKRGAVIASDYMKNCLMIPIYNSRLNNDTVKSWQPMINGASYKTYLVWRMAGDELHSDTNSW